MKGSEEATETFLLQYKARSTLCTSPTSTLPLLHVEATAIKSGHRKIVESRVRCVQVSLI